jgi:pyruvate dehydrogenase E2 component (dihydrolipoamide acetyltransferase)
MKVSVNIKMPKWDLSMKEGIITRWFKKEGDTVDKGEDLFEVEAKKIINKIQSPAAGRLSQIMIPVRTRVPVKVVVAILAGPGE